MMNDSYESFLNHPVIINYKSRGCIINLNDNQLIVPLMGEGLVSNNVITVFASYKGDFLGGDSSKILIRLADGRVVAILRSSVISIRRL